MWLGVDPDVLEKTGRNVYTFYLSCISKKFTSNQNNQKLLKIKIIE